MATEFKIALHRFDVNLLPPDARQVGTEAFKMAVMGHFAAEYAAQGQTALVTLDDKEITVMAFPAEASALDFVMPILKAGKFDEALPYLESLTKSAPANASVLYNLGICYSELGQFDEAIIRLKRAVQIDPGYAHASVGIGNAYHQMSKPNQAPKAIEKAAKADPNTNTIRRVQLGDNADHLVIIVPGIRDRGGDWGKVQKELAIAGFLAVVVTWNEYFGLPRFLVPAPWFRRLAINELEQRIWDAIKEHTIGRKQPRVSFIAHSFGSYILCYLLRRQHLFEVNRIILCGSVLSRNFRFSKFSNRFEAPIINDVGKDDKWPFVASCVTFGYGTIGTYGYLNVPVLDRFHEQKGHDAFTDAEFCRTWWIPALRNNDKTFETPSPNVPKQESTVWKTANGLLQNIKWLVLLLLALIPLHFVPRTLPCIWQVNIGLRDVPCSVGIDLQRISDMSKLGCRNGVRYYEIVNQDTLTFSNAPKHYYLQAQIPKGATLRIVDGSGTQILLEKTTKILSESGWFRSTQRVNFAGTVLKLRYEYSGEAPSTDNDWGFAFVSTLPIRSVSAQAVLPVGKSVSGTNAEKIADNSAFGGCTFSAGLRPRLDCKSPLHNEPNIPQSLYWDWNVFQGC